MKIEDIMPDLLDTLGETKMDDTETETLGAIILEASNSGDPPIDNLGRYTFAVDVIRWLLYVGKITIAQTGVLISVVGESLKIDGCFMAEENKEE